MTPNHEPTSVPGAMFQAWSDFWAKYLEAGTDCSKVLFEKAGGDGPGDFETLRRAWLSSLGKSMDAYLRTPAFLEMIHRHFDAMTCGKISADDFTKEVARNAGLPHLDDISGLFERLQIGQEAILNRLAVLERRLEALEATKKTNGQRKAHSSH
jgi:hypothetical protein